MHVCYLVILPPVPKIVLHSCTLPKTASKVGRPFLAPMFRAHLIQCAQRGANSSARQPQNENTPSAGTERIDRIGKCHSGLWDGITSSSKTAVLVIFAERYIVHIVHDIPTCSLHCSDATRLRPHGLDRSSRTLHSFT